ncbi:hypothetical protein, partial [Phenylobacterium aquaticum]|uniref:hypothetical protein n=1 Tax=Phenylobacterium aquaticum TaxID=1763816 RepID=UPI0026EC7F36
ISGGAQGGPAGLAFKHAGSFGGARVGAARQAGGGAEMRGLNFREIGESASQEQPLILFMFWVSYMGGQEP